MTPTTTAPCRAHHRSRRSWRAPEALQTSALDCGPAVLAAALTGYGRPQPLDALRAACRTARDGTSIDALEELACAHGLAAEQVLVPPEHLFLPDAACIPAILVLALPDGAAHFVLLWRLQGSHAQLMDPARGRHWLKAAHLANQLYHHRAIVPATLWESWARSDDHLRPLAARLARLGLPAAARRTLIRSAVDRQGWQALAALDACTRFTAALAAQRAFSRRLRSNDNGRLLAALVESTLDPAATAVVPATFWTVRRLSTPDPDHRTAPTELLAVEGALLVRLAAPRAASPVPPLRSDVSDERPHPTVRFPLGASTRPSTLTSNRTPNASTKPTVPALAAAATCLAAAVRCGETWLWAGTLQLLPALAATRAAPLLIAALALWRAAAALLEHSAAATARHSGRHRDTLLRQALTLKLPTLADSYLQSRLLADLAERAFAIRHLRRQPEAQAARDRAAADCLLAPTLLGAIAAPRSAAAAAALAAAAILLPRVAARRIEQHAARLRTATGALAALHLDVLRGLTAIHSHSAEPSFHRRHDALLAAWQRTWRAADHAALYLEAVTATTTAVAATAFLLPRLLSNGGEHLALPMAAATSLLLGAGRQLAHRTAVDLPRLHLLLRRIEEPLAAAEDEREDEPAPATGRRPCDSAAGAAHPTAPLPPRAVALRLRHLGLQKDGRWLLRNVELTVDPGEHVALLGASGAGKSTLLGLLLGWHVPSEGQLLIDGRPLDDERRASLRAAIAWSAPKAALWEGTLLENLASPSDLRGFPLPPIEALRLADLLTLVGARPNGLQMRVGETGANLSGGEGQRLRLARALRHPAPRLVLLDEPFRGLAADQRRALLAAVREVWRHATLLYVTHSPSEALRFDRVLVVERGAVPEAASPAQLAADPGSRFSSLLAAEAAAASMLARWRRLHLEHGRTAPSAHFHQTHNPAKG